MSFSAHGCNASYIARRVRGDSPGMDTLGTTYMRRGITEGEHDIRQLEGTLVALSNNNSQTSSLAILHEMSSARCRT